MPQLDINWNKILGIIATAGAGLASHWIMDSHVRDIAVMAITGIMGTISVKAQTLNPDGSQIEGKNKP